MNYSTNIIRHVAYDYCGSYKITHNGDVYYYGAHIDMRGVFYHIKTRIKQDKLGTKILSDLIESGKEVKFEVIEYFPSYVLAEKEWELHLLYKDKAIGYKKQKFYANFTSNRTVFDIFDQLPFSVKYNGDRYNIELKKQYMTYYSCNLCEYVCISKQPSAMLEHSIIYHGFKHERTQSYKKRLPLIMSLLNTYTRNEGYQLVWRCPICNEWIYSGALNLKGRFILKYNKVVQHLKRCDYKNAKKNKRKQ